MTFGAGGSTRDRTLGTVLDIRAMGHAAAPHISCIASTRDSIREWLQRYKDHGIKHLVALRGDLPSGLAASRRVSLRERTGRIHPQGIRRYVS